MPAPVPARDHLGHAVDGDVACLERAASSSTPGSGDSHTRTSKRSAGSRVASSHTTRSVAAHAGAALGEQQLHALVVGPQSGS